MEELIAEIKKKKTLKNLDASFIKKYITSIPEKKKNIKKTVKETRNILNRIYGQFWLDNKFNLSSHKSTKERLEIYSSIYKKIFSITGKPNSILDLGCGLNPLSYNYLDCKPKYTAVELTKEDCKKINEYFKNNKIDGTAISKDLTRDSEFPKADVCFMFKLLESLEEKNHKLSEKLITSINCKWIIVSFSLLTIRNRRMNYPRRGWFERMLKRLNLKYEIIKEDNEIFYILLKG